MDFEQLHVALGTGGPRKDLMEIAQAADRLGYEALWLTELASREVFGLLAELALKTSRIELGAGIVNYFSRTPALLALSISTLGELAQRPINLGLGSSSRKVIEDLHGMSFDRPARRLSEAIEVIRLALSGQRIDYSGEIFRLRDFRMETVGNAPIRVYVAGSTPAFLEITGRLADGWLPIHPSRRGLGGFVSDLRSAARRADRAMPTIAAYVYTYVGEDWKDGATAIRATIARYIATGGEGYRNLFRRYGYSDEVERISALWRGGQRQEASGIVGDEMLHDVTLVGAGADVVEQLASLGNVGIDHPVLRFADGVSAERVVGMLEAIAKRVKADRG